MVASEQSIKEGVVYCLTAARYLDEAELSIRSLRRHEADIPVVLCVSEDLTEIPWAAGLGVEIKVLETVTRSFLDKIHAMQSCGLDRLLYLDTDVYVAGPVRDLLVLLDDYDIIASHAPVRLQYPDYEAAQLSPMIPQFQAGIIVMHHNDSLFADWFSEQARLSAWLDTQPGDLEKVQSDQVGLRLAVHKRRDIRLLLMPPEFNLRPMQSFSGKPRLIHDRNFLLLPEVKKQRLLGWMSRPAPGDPRGPNPGQMRPKVAFLYPRSLLKRAVNAFRRSGGRVIDL